MLPAEGNVALENLLQLRLHKSDEQHSSHRMRLEDLWYSSDLLPTMVTGLAPEFRQA